MTAHDNSFRRTGGSMTEHDFGETYTFLEFFLRTYVIHEDEVRIILKAILETYLLGYNRADPIRALKRLRNPWNAGRKKQITNEEVRRIRELHNRCHSVRRIAEETGVPRSSVQRRLNELTVP